MTPNRKLSCLISILLIFALFSCAANLEKRKHQSKVTRTLGEAYMRQGNYTEALKELLKAEELYPNDHLLQNDLGLVYMAKKSFDNAEVHFKKAIELKPEYAAAKNNLGTVYLATENWDAAIASFREVLGDLLYATPHFPYSNLGLAYFHKGDYRQAELNYLKALEIEPNFVLALRGLGKTYLAMNRISAAISEFEKAVQQAPNFAELYMDLGDAYQQSHAYKKALLSYRKVVELAPDTPLSERAAKEAATLERFSD
jgi:type IV pilus assembly protein PilF